MHARKRTIILTVILLSLLWISACSTQPPVPVNRYYHFPAPVVTTPTRSKPVYKNILLRRPVVRGIYNERAILNVLASRPLEINRYHYHLWSEPPAMLVHDSLALFLRASGIAAEVYKRASGTTPEVMISSRILRFEQIKMVSEHDALIRIEFSVRINGKTKLLEYEAKVKAKSSDMHAQVKAFGGAMDEISAKLVKALIKLSM